MIGHRGPISGVATDGRSIATAGYDNQLIMWDAKTGESLNRGLHDHLVNMCTFAGGDLFSASSDHTARRWRPDDMRLLTVYADHEDDVEMCAPSHDASMVATASRDHRVRVFEVDGSLRWIGTGHLADVISVAWKSDDREVISSGDDGTIRRWDAETGELLDTVDLAGVETDTIVITGGGVVLAGNDDGEILIIDGDARDLVPAHASGVKRLVFDGSKRVASMSYDRTVRIWNLDGATLTPVAHFDLPVEVWPRSAAFLDIDTMVFGTFGTTYITLDLDDGTWCRDRYEPTPGVNAVLAVDDGSITVGDAGIVRRGDRAVAMGSLCNFLSAWGDRIVTGGQTGELFDASTGDVIHQHRSPLNCATPLHPSRPGPLAVGTYTGEVLLFRAHRDLISPPTVIGLHDNAIKGLASNGRHLFSVCATGAAAAVDITDPENRHEVDDAHTRIANGVAALADGRFATVSRDRALRVFSIDEQDGTWSFDVQEIETPHTHSIKCVAAHPSLPIVATGSYNGTVAIHDLRTSTWTEVTRPTAAGISSLAPDPNRDCFLASSYDASVYEVGRRASAQLLERRAS